VEAVHWDEHYVTPTEMLDLAKGVLAQGGFAFIAIVSLFMLAKVYRDREAERTSFMRELARKDEEQRLLVERHVDKSEKMLEKQHERQVAGDRVTEAIAGILALTKRRPE